MLNRQKREVMKPDNHSDKTSLIAQGTMVCGELHFSGSLHLDGCVEGTVIGDGENALFTLSEHGQVRGEIRVAKAIINGQVHGDVFTSKRLELSEQSRITGDVHYHELEMTAGAQVNGRMTHANKEPTHVATFTGESGIN